jgi:uncharacterized protein (TIGR03435 family)
MKRSAIPTLLLFAGAAGAQSFEVISIKPAAPQPMGQVRVGMGGDQGRINYSNTSIKEMIQRAFEVKSYQVTGPPTIDTERFDVTAKIPEGQQSQVPAMLRAMLADRFRLETHRETKELPVYELNVAKGGANLQPSEGEGRPQIRMEMTDRGASLKVDSTPMGNFCDALSRFLDRPVLDKTALAGNYNLALDMAPEDLAGMRGGGIVRMGPGGGGGRGDAGGPAPESAPTGSLFTSLGKLGLKLEPRKAAIETIVVDKVEKTPTEN